MFGSAVFATVIPNAAPYYDSERNYFRDILHLDCLIRYAVSGKSEKLFKKLAENFFAAGTEYISSIHILCVSIILYKKRKFGMLDIFIEVMKNFNRMRNNSHYSDNMNIVNLKKYLTMMNKFVMGVGEYEETGGTDEFMTSPCYFAMITNNAEEFKKYILSEEFERNSGLYFCSAIAFRNTEILQLLFESGVAFPAGDLELIADLCLDKGTAEYLTLNFSKYIFPDRQEISDISDKKMPAFFIQQMISHENMTVFAQISHRKAGTKQLCKIFRDMPKISLIEENDIGIIWYFYHENFPLKEIFADTVECMVENGYYLFEENRDIPGIKLLYDFTYVDRTCLYHRKIAKIINLLKSSETRFLTNTLSYPVREMLDRNHDALTKLLISKKIINRVNAYEVIDHLTDRKLFVALNAVNQSEIPDIDTQES